MAGYHPADNTRYRLFFTSPRTSLTWCSLALTGGVSSSAARQYCEISMGGLHPCRPCLSRRPTASCCIRCLCVWKQTGPGGKLLPCSTGSAGGTPAWTEPQPQVQEVPGRRGATIGRVPIAGSIRPIWDRPRRHGHHWQWNRYQGEIWLHPQRWGWIRWLIRTQGYFRSPPSR